MTLVVGPAWTDGNDGRYAGRYPLAVERHAMAQVGSLLPGITTVTSHARYYTLHAWVFAEAKNHGLDGDATRRLLRRAEVVVGAASLAHQSSGRHEGFRGVHGSDRLSSHLGAGTIDLDALAADRGYVQASWGFWGPYVAPEYGLGLLASGERNSTVPGPHADLDALSSGFNGLWDLTQRSSLSVDDLNASAHVCICQGGSAVDGALLRRLLMPESAEAMHAGDRRSQTLRMLLRLTDLLGRVENPERELAHALVYGDHRDDTVISAFEATPAWTGVILRNELVAGWRNLWAFLVECIDGFMAIDDLGAALADGLPSGTVGDFAKTLPRGFDADGAVVDGHRALDVGTIGRASFLMARLFISASRHGRLESRTQAYLQADRDERFQQLTPEWTQQRIQEWTDRPLRDFALWLTHQLVARAERVALAKASFERRTGRFKIPTRVFVRDGHIFRDSHEGGGGVALRWGSAFQIMAGVGLVEYRDRNWHVTDLGRAA